LRKSDRYLGIACGRKDEIQKNAKTSMRSIENGGGRQARTRAGGLRIRVISFLASWMATRNDETRAKCKVV
jgi:hypothetical protein